MNDILDHADKAAKAGISKSKLREAVVLFTRRLDYLACLKAREMRIDLAGNHVEEVSAEEAEAAAVKIKKRVEKSVRNARKLIGTKSNPSSSLPPSYIRNTPSPSTEHYLPTYPPRSPAYATPTPNPAKAPVVVKHKTTRQFDPNAVARLKEKLGLSRGIEEKKETTD